MLHLLESQHLPEHRRGGAVASLAVHALLLTFAVQLTSIVTTRPPPTITERLVMVEPLEPKPEPPPEPPDAAPPVAVAPSLLPAKGFQVLVAPVRIPDVLPDIDLSKAITNEADFSGRGVAGGVATGIVGGVVTKSPVAIDGQTYMESQVEEIAAPMPGNEPPAYPALLRSANVEGTLLVQFIVDTTGGVERSSIKVLNSPHQLFTESVLRVLVKYRFRPARVGSRPVRMLAQQPFEFSLQTR